MKIRKLISAYKTKWLGSRHQLVTVSLLGKSLTVSNGCINKKADKDDAWWYALASRHDYIFDIGANVGFSTILACIDNPGKQVLLADPNPEALKLAKENLERNGMGGQKIYINAFAGAQAGEQVKFYTLGTGSAGSMYGSHADSARSVNATYMVATTTIDDIVEEQGLVPQLMKIDVEAAESFVLSGSAQLAEKQQTIIMVEMHGPEEMPMERNATLVLDWCNKNNYCAYYMKEHKALLKAGDIAHRGRCHLLLLPEAMPYPDYLNSIKEGDKIAALS